MFVDLTKIFLEAGDGGNGIVSYRREYMVQNGGPYGGNGGRGGNIIFIGESGLSTLLDLRYHKKIKGNKGENGRTKGMYGAGAKDTYVRVPVGTTVYDDETGKVLADIVKHGQEFVIAKGGRGGRGNMAFATGTVKCPDYAEKGQPGQKLMVRCELKVLADCGLIGFPSVGKSTIISRVSAAKPKIASYHFTTIVPNLGMVQVPDGKRSFVMADLPGIIEGASQGLGLGFQFLRHIERCRVIVHVIDMSGMEGRNPIDDYKVISEELKTYKMNLSKRPEIVVANKMDIPNAQENLTLFKEAYPDKEVIEISALNNANLDLLVYKIADLIDNTEEFSLFEEDELQSHVDYTFEKEKSFFEIEEVSPGVYNVVGDKIQELFEMTNFNNDASVRRFARQLRSYGVDTKLRELGVRDGDTVCVFDYEFEFFD